VTEHKPTSTAGRRIRGLDPEQRREQRRHQLLGAALELFATHGYAATSIEQICQSAYVGTKGFYEFFTSRESCYIALLHEVTERIESQMTELLATVPDDQEAAERVLVTGFAHTLIDDPRVAMVTFGAGRAISPQVERQRRANRRWAASFVHMVWARHGVIPAGPGLDLHRISVGLIGGLFDLVSDWLLDADPRDQAAVDSLINDLLAYYGAVRAGVLAQTVTIDHRQA
jgi:AcrR family transcriptional regulator